MKEVAEVCGCPLANGLFAPTCGASPAAGEVSRERESAVKHHPDVRRWADAGADAPQGLAELLRQGRAPVGAASEVAELAQRSWRSSAPVELAGTRRSLGAEGVGRASPRRNGRRRCTHGRRCRAARGLERAKHRAPGDLGGWRCWCGSRLVARGGRSVRRPQRAAPDPAWSRNGARRWELRRRPRPVQSPRLRSTRPSSPPRRPLPSPPSPASRRPPRSTDVHRRRAPRRRLDPMRPRSCRRRRPPSSRVRARRSSSPVAIRRASRRGRCLRSARSSRSRPCGASVVMMPPRLALRRSSVATAAPSTIRGSRAGRTPRPPLAGL